MIEYTFDVPTIDAGESSDDSAVDIDEEEAEHLWEELREARLELDLPPDARLDDFRVVARGGPSVMALKGVAYGCYTGQAIGHEVEKWFRDRGMHMSSRYEISLFTAPFSNLMAACW